MCAYSCVCRHTYVRMWYTDNAHGDQRVLVNVVSWAMNFWHLPVFAFQVLGYKDTPLSLAFNTGAEDNKA